MSGIYIIEISDFWRLRIKYEVSGGLAVDGVLGELDKVRDFRKLRLNYEVSAGLAVGRTLGELGIQGDFKGAPPLGRG